MRGYGAFIMAPPVTVFTENRKNGHFGGYGRFLANSKFVLPLFTDSLVFEFLGGALRVRTGLPVVS